MTRRKPTPPPQGLRQRVRADGSTRLWWEPTPAARKLGFAATDLDADRMDWSRREAQRLNAEVARAQGAGRKTPAARGRAVEDLLRLYRASPDWQRLKPKTRNSYDKLLSVIGAKWGQARVQDFDKAVMWQWYETNYAARGTAMAAALNRMMSVLFSYAEKQGWRPDNSNPCFRLGVRTPGPRGRSASWAELDALIGAAQALGQIAAQRAILLGWFTGQRQTDILAAPRAAFTLHAVAMPGDAEERPVWVWRLRRSKRANIGVLPLHPEVIPHVRLALMDTGPADAPFGPNTALLLDEATGRGYDEHLFAKRWAAIRARAAETMPSVATLQFRDLRRSWGVQSRAGGSSNDDTGDVLGNSVATSPQLEEIYLPPSFQTTLRAVMAVQRPQPKRETKG